MLRPRRLALDLDLARAGDARRGRRREPRPPFLRIARALVEAIRRGRLRPGDALPGSRRLAVDLGVHRNTVLAALAELAAQGWLETSPARGTYVARSLPLERAPRSPVRHGSRSRAFDSAGFDLPGRPEEYRPPRLAPGTLNLSNGAPDVRLAPMRALGRAYRRAMAHSGRRLLAYGDPEGHPALRAALAAMLTSERGLAAGADDVLVTRGSQMALALVARAVLAPGDVVAVESLGYRPAWEAFRAAGAKVVPIPVDPDGVDVEALATLVRSHRVRAVYVTPHHQYPTTVTLKAARRLALLALSRQRRIAVVEDDYDHEFHYDGRPVLPLASADSSGSVIYIGTLSKVLAPGLRIGYVVAPRPVIALIAAHRSLLDIQGDLPTEAAVAALLEEGEVERHIARARRIYAARREVLTTSLRHAFGHDVAFRPAPGGMALWVRFLMKVDVERWARRSLDHGVSFYTGRRYAFDRRPGPFARFSFAWLNEREIPEAVRRLHTARP
jgi:GntR family transcriptional regulator/MocR family aminotransferase